MTKTRLVTLGGLVALMLATSACHRHWHRHHHRHHSEAGMIVPSAAPGPVAAEVRAG